MRNRLQTIKRQRAKNIKETLRARLAEPHEGDDGYRVASKTVTRLARKSRKRLITSFSEGWQQRYP